MSEAGEGKTRTGLRSQPPSNPGRNPAGVEVLETFTFGFSWFERRVLGRQTTTLRTHSHKTRPILEIVKKYAHLIVLVNEDIKVIRYDGYHH